MAAGKGRPQRKSTIPTAFEDWTAARRVAAARASGSCGFFTIGPVRHVFVGGQQIVGDGNALAFDYADASARLKLAQCRRDHAADLSREVKFSRFSAKRSWRVAWPACPRWSAEVA